MGGGAPPPREMGVKMFELAQTNPFTPERKKGGGACRNGYWARIRPRVTGAWSLPQSVHCCAALQHIHIRFDRCLGFTVHSSAQLTKHHYMTPLYKENHAFRVTPAGDPPMMLKSGAETLQCSPTLIRSWGIQQQVIGNQMCPYVSVTQKE